MVEYAVISEKGRRDYMEDRFQIVEFGPSSLYIGVYDGHSGDYVAQYARDNLSQVVTSLIIQGISPEEAFVKAYQKISDEVRTLSSSGACAADFMIQDDILSYANAGDSRIIVVGDEYVRQLTHDHRATDPTEKQRLEEAGGSIWRTYLVYYTSTGVLRGSMVGRSLGDREFTRFGLIATPETGTYTLSISDKWIINACDGLYDVMTNEEIAKMARQANTASELTAMLKTEVLDNRAGSDNLTIVALKLPI